MTNQKALVTHCFWKMVFSSVTEPHYGGAQLTKIQTADENEARHTDNTEKFRMVKNGSIDHSTKQTGILKEHHQSLTDIRETKQSGKEYKILHNQPCNLSVLKSKL